MTFIPQAPKIFNRLSIGNISSNITGVYGLFRAGQWIYIGKGNIRERLLAHFNGDNPYILRAQPTHWVGEALLDPQMSLREKELILLHKPLCNQKVG